MTSTPVSLSLSPAFIDSSPPATPRTPTSVSARQSPSGSDNRSFASRLAAATATAAQDCEAPVAPGPGLLSRSRSSDERLGSTPSAQIEHDPGPTGPSTFDNLGERSLAPAAAPGHGPGSELPPYSDLSNHLVRLSDASSAALPSPDGSVVRTVGLRVPVEAGCRRFDGPPFPFLGVLWRIVVLFWQSTLQGAGLYLEALNLGSAEFEISVTFDVQRNLDAPGRSAFRPISSVHKFTADVPTWGWGNVLPKSELSSPTRGWVVDGFMSIVLVVERLSTDAFVARQRRQDTVRVVIQRQREVELLRRRQAADAQPQRFPEVSDAALLASLISRRVRELDRVTERVAAMSSAADGPRAPPSECGASGGNDGDDDDDDAGSECELGASPAAPAEFRCPVGLHVMWDPVMTADGRTYERAEIARWLHDHDTSPLTRAVLAHKHLVPNWTLRSMIDAWRQGRQSARANKRLRDA